MSQKHDFSGSRLAYWNASHAASLRLTSDGLEFSDTLDANYHLMSVSNPAFIYAILELRAVLTPCETCNTFLYFNHWGGIDLGSISQDGDVLTNGASESIQVEKGPQNQLIVNISWSSASQTILVGTCSSDGQAIYAGSGDPQWMIHSIEVTCRSIPSRDDDPIVLVDVGAAGGIDCMWAPLLPKLRCVLVEPDPKQAEHLRNAFRGYPSALVLEAALSDQDETKELNVARYGECSSLLEPDFSELGRYAVAPCFEVIRKLSIPCRRYDSLEGAPAPDIIKIDVQGAEYQVLKGFGRYLDTVLAIELESHFYPIYKGQKLIGDLVAMLAEHGLRLRQLSPQYSFDRDFVEVNAYFSREAVFDPSRQGKLDIIHKMLNLPFHETGRLLANQMASRGVLHTS